MKNKLLITVLIVTTLAAFIGWERAGYYKADAENQRFARYEKEQELMGVWFALAEFSNIAEAKYEWNYERQEYIRIIAKLKGYDGTIECIGSDSPYPAIPEGAK